MWQGLTASQALHQSFTFMTHLICTIAHEEGTVIFHIL